MKEIISNQSNNTKNSTIQNEDIALSNKNKFEENSKAQDLAVQQLLEKISNNELQTIKISDILKKPLTTITEELIGLPVMTVMSESKKAKARLLEVLDKVIKTKVDILELDLSNMNIGNYSNITKIISKIDYIAKKGNVKSINLSGNALEHFQLLDAKKIFNVKNLNLSNNNIKSLDFITEFSCENLDISNNNLQDEIGINQLIKKGQNLVSLDISNNSLQIQEVNKYIFGNYNSLRNHKSLKHIKFTNVEANDETLIALTKMFYDSMLSFPHFYNIMSERRELGNKVLQTIEFASNTPDYIKSSIKYLTDKKIVNSDHLITFANKIKVAYGVDKKLVSTILLELVAIGFNNNHQEITDLKKLIDFKDIIEYIRDDKSKVYEILITNNFINRIIENNDALFQAARNNSEDIIKILLEHNPELINTIDEEGHSLGYFFSQDKEMLQYFFALGYIPKGDESISKNKHKLSDITGVQTVHNSHINNANNFYIKTLKEVSKYQFNPQDSKKLLEHINHYNTFVSKFSKILPFDFLSVKNIKHSLIDNESLQHAINLFANKDQKKLLQDIIDKVLFTISNKYLKIGGEYSDYSHQYDFNDDKCKTTLKELILNVHNFIQNKELSNTEVKMVLTDVIKHNNINSIDLENKSIEEYNKIFEEITKGVSLKDYIYHKDLFTMMLQLFKAATTYGDYSSACAHGTVAQVIQVLPIVDNQFIEKYSTYQSEKTDELNEHNLSKIVEEIVESLIDNEKIQFKRDLSKLISAKEDINIPVSVLQAINTKFIEIAQKSLPYFKNHIPTQKDYSLLMHSIKTNTSLINNISYDIMEENNEQLIIADTYNKYNPFNEKMKLLQEKQEVIRCVEEDIISKIPAVYIEEIIQGMISNIIGDTSSIIEESI